MTEFLYKDGQKFSRFTAEAVADGNALRNVVLQSKSFWMVSCCKEALLPSTNNQAFAYGVVTLYVGLETSSGVETSCPFINSRA